MFTGIVEELGTVQGLSKRGNIALLTIKADKILEDTKISDSIAINGVCLTVIKKERNSLVFEVMDQTLKITNLGLLKISDKVNLERSLKIGDRLSGHFVYGHIDLTVAIRKRGYVDGNLCFEIALPQKFSDYILPKGSIAVDGISLTVAEKKPGGLSVYIIPHTLKNTTLGYKGPSDKVNIEFDILAKKSNNLNAAFNF
jgi:riboflavin synthase